MKFELKTIPFSDGANGCRILGEFHAGANLAQNQIGSLMGETLLGFDILKIV